MKKRILALALVVMMLATTCISYTASAADASVESYLTFDMSATINEDDSSIIDVVLSIKDVKEELHAVEFLLNFDPSIVEGVVQESEAPMDVFMTKVPMYTMAVQGVEFQMSRYEQICTYEPENKYYHLRFIDLLQYASAKPGEEYPGLINDGDLIVTIQFRIIDADATEFAFSATKVKGTTTVGLNGVKGTDASVTYSVATDDETSEEVTSEDVLPDDSTADDVTSEEVTSEDVTSEDVTSEDVSADEPVVKENYAKDKSYTVGGSFLGGKADDGVILTDGIIPEAEIPGSTVAFSGTGATSTIIVDLGSVYTDINQIVVGGVVIAGNRQYGTVVIEISEDGTNYTALADYTETEVVYAGTTNNYVYDLAADVAARYIKISLTSKEYVLTVGDIQVYGSGNAADEDVTSEEATSDVVDETSDVVDETSDVADETSDVADETSDADDVVTSEGAADETSEEATTEETPEETTEEATTEDAPVDPGKPGDAGIVAFVVLAVLALAAITVCKKARRA